MRSLIWGAGAIGGTLGAYLARAGKDVTMVDTVVEHVDAIACAGLRVTGPIDEFTVRVPAFAPQTLSGTWDEIILATKAHHTDAAVRARRPHLTGNGYVVSAQNGLNELAIAREILAVASARSVQPEAFDGFDPAAYLTSAPPGAAERSLDALVAHNRRSAKSHSGIWRDLAVRKRPTEVDAQLGIVVRFRRPGRSADTAHRTTRDTGSRHRARHPSAVARHTRRPRRDERRTSNAERRTTGDH